LLFAKKVESAEPKRFEESLQKKEGIYEESDDEFQDTSRVCSIDDSGSC
jgi:hypothetical protein